MENQVQQEQRLERRKRSDTVVSPFGTIITGHEPVVQANTTNTSVTCPAGTFQPVSPATQQQAVQQHAAPTPGTIGY